MRGKYLFAKGKTKQMGACSVLITHPYHPFSGQRVKVIRKLRGVRGDLVVQMPDGVDTRVPRDWTDYEVSQEGEADSVSAPSHLLDIEGLLEAVKIVESIKKLDSIP